MPIKRQAAGNMHPITIPQPFIPRYSDYTYGGHTYGSLQVVEASRSCKGSCPVGGANRWPFTAGRRSPDLPVGRRELSQQLGGRLLERVFGQFRQETAVLCVAPSPRREGYSELLRCPHGRGSSFRRLRMCRPQGYRGKGYWPRQRLQSYCYGKSLQSLKSSGTFIYPLGVLYSYVSPILIILYNYKLKPAFFSYFCTRVCMYALTPSRITWMVWISLATDGSISLQLRAWWTWWGFFTWNQKIPNLWQRLRGMFNWIWLSMQPESLDWYLTKIKWEKWSWRKKPWPKNYVLQPVMFHYNKLRLNLPMSLTICVGARMADYTKVLENVCWTLPSVIVWHCDSRSILVRATYFVISISWNGSHFNKML